MSIGNDHIRALFLKKASQQQDPAAAAMAAAAKQVPSALPVPTLAPKPDQAAEGDPVADQAKMEEAHRKELERKDKELNTLRNNNEVMQVQMAHLKALAALDKHREQVYKNIEKKEQDHRRNMEKEDIALQQKKERMAAEEIKHQAKMDVASAHQQAQAAEAQAKATAQQAQQNAQQYVKMTEDVRKNSDNYFAQRSKELDKRKMDLDAQQKKLDAEGSRISPIVMNRLNSAVKATQGLGSIREKLQGTPGISASSTLEALNKVATFGGPGTHITAAQNQYKAQSQIPGPEQALAAIDDDVLPMEYQLYYDSIPGGSKRVDKLLAEADAIKKKQQELMSGRRVGYGAEWNALEKQRHDAIHKARVLQYALALNRQAALPFGATDNLALRLRNADIELQRLRQGGTASPEQLLAAEAKVQSLMNEYDKLRDLAGAHEADAADVLAGRLQSEHGLDAEAAKNTAKAFLAERVAMENYLGKTGVGALGTGESEREDIQKLTFDAPNYLKNALVGNGALWRDVLDPAPEGLSGAAEWSTAIAERGAKDIAASTVEYPIRAFLSGVNAQKAYNKAQNIAKSQGEKLGDVSVRTGAILNEHGLPTSLTSTLTGAGADFGTGVADLAMTVSGGKVLGKLLGAGGAKVLPQALKSPWYIRYPKKVLVGTAKTALPVGAMVGGELLRNPGLQGIPYESQNAKALGLRPATQPAAQPASTSGEFKSLRYETPAYYPSTSSTPASPAQPQEKKAAAPEQPAAQPNEQPPAVQTSSVTVQDMPKTWQESNTSYNTLNIGHQLSAARDSNSWLRRNFQYIAPFAAAFGINLQEPGATRRPGTPINFARATVNAPNNVTHTIAANNPHGLTAEGMKLNSTLQQSAQQPYSWMA